MIVIDMDLEQSALWALTLPRAKLPDQILSRAFAPQYNLSKTTGIRGFAAIRHLNLKPGATHRSYLVARRLPTPAGSPVVNVRARS